jgi:putative ATP-dependent endonuclease of OLD family
MVKVTPRRWLEALGGTRLSFAAIADDEGTQPGRWATLKTNMTDRLLRWEGTCTERVVIDLLPEGQLPALLKTDDGAWNGERLRTLATRLDIEDKSLEAIQQALSKHGRTLRTAIIDAATGNPEGAPEGAKKEWQASTRASPRLLGTSRANAGRRRRRLASIGRQDIW